MSEPLIYIVIFISFLVVMKFILPKFNQAVQKVSGLEKIHDEGFKSFEIWAKSLGLSFQRVAKSDDKKVWQGGGCIISGEYQGLPVTIKLLSETREYSSGLEYGYEYVFDNSIEVKTSDVSSWEVLPKDPALQYCPTGVAEFDDRLTYLGHRKLSEQHLKKIAAYGWMELKSEGGILKFRDDYMKHLQNTKGSMAMLNAIHPVWKTGPQNTQVDQNSATAFLDLLIDLAKS